MVTTAATPGVVVDLRSDTVTRPTPAMRAAMAAAEVGDDVYREDPTIRRLEETAAERLGKEAALLCPSGVMCNQLWLRVLAAGGTEVLCDAECHLVNYEGGAGALLAGVQFRTVDAPRGVITATQAAAWIRPDRFPLTPTTMIAVEQTNNRRGGTCYTPRQLVDLGRLARGRGVSLYCDGARVFNAAVALDVAPDALMEPVDGLQVCLSKGLGAPVGSLMVGREDDIAEARRWRSRYGGAMRQAGVIAAAGLVALDHMVDRLADDHARARRLAHAIADLDPDRLDPSSVETNIVVVEDVDAHGIVAALGERGVRASALSDRTLRFVTHPDVDDAGIDATITALRQVGLPAAPPPPTDPEQDR